jgi:predicted metal-dependent hydrolase
MTPSLSSAPGLEQIQVKLGNRRIAAQLRRTHRRVLRIEVRPSGEVIVLAPIGEEGVKVAERVHRRAAWIFRQVDRVLERPAVTPERRFVSGETHLLLGKQYRLAIEQGNTPQVRVVGSRLHVTVRRVDDRAQCRRLLAEFYAVTARSVFSERLKRAAAPFIRRGLRMPSLIVRRMSKRWGSYTVNHRIVINVDLIRAHVLLIDYVICHELAHAFHADHGKDWQRLLNTVMPDWQERKSRLEKLLR